MDGIWLRDTDGSSVLEVLGTRRRRGLRSSSSLRFERSGGEGGGEMSCRGARPFKAAPTAGGGGGGGALFAFSSAASGIGSGESLQQKGLRGVRRGLKEPLLHALAEALSEMVALHVSEI